MQTVDVVNGLFEAFGAYTAWANFARLRRDQEIKGVYWPMWAFFSAWGLWNCFYYPSLNQWFSFVAGAALCAGNIAWTVLAVRLALKKLRAADARLQFLRAADGARLQFLREIYPAMPSHKGTRIVEISPSLSEGDCRLDECDTKVFFRYPEQKGA